MYHSSVKYKTVMVDSHSHMYHSSVNSHSHMYHSSVKYKTVMVDNTCINKSTINYRNKSDRGQYNISPDLGQA